MDLLGRSQRCHDCIRALEEERRKIEAFQRELPLCLQLVTQAIDSVRQQIGDDGRARDGPVLEEFIPLKPTSTSTSSEERNGEKKRTAGGSETKPDWLRTVQLWNQEPDTVLKVEPPKKPIAVSLKKMGGAFQPFERDKYVMMPPAPALPAVAASSTTSGSGDGDRGGGDGCGSGGDKAEKEKEGQSQSHRKVRRCWSPELHRRFLQALQQLGGSHAATPKQIRELMKVDRLTNDEVKSHLQKYRLHTRRPGNGAVGSSSGSPAAPQFVLVGEIFVPPPDYATAAQPAGNRSACAPHGGIYAPVASLPSDLRLQQQQIKNIQSHRSINNTGPSLSEIGRSSGDQENSMEEEEDEDDDEDEDDATNRSASPASSQTTTASPH